MQMKKFFAVMMIALLTVMTMTTGQVANAAATDRTTGSLTVHKYELEKDKLETGETGTGKKGQGIPTDAETLSGVEYTITQTHSYKPSTNEWTKLDDLTKNVQVLTTDSLGVAKFTNLDLGRYLVKETKGPSHVNLNPKEFAVDIPMTNVGDTKVNYDVHIYPKNETIRGAVELFKADGDSKVGLAGAVFNLYDSKKVLVKENVQVNDDGYIYVDGLAYGEYYFTEVTAPGDYVLQSGEFEFEVSKSGTIDADGVSTGKVEKVVVKNYLKPDIVKEVDQSTANRGDTVTYTLKIDLPADIKNYKEFVITDVLDDNLTYVDGSQEGAVGFKFNADKQTLTWTADKEKNLGDFSVLEPGPLTITFDAKIAENASGTKIDNTASIDYKNNSGTTGDKITDPTLVTLTDGGFTVLKVDAADKKTLAGAEFKLTDVAGNTIDAGGTLIKVNGESYTGKLDNLKTLGNGVFIIDGLDVGTYNLVETKAPTYLDGETEKSYRLLTKPIEVKVTAIDTSENKTVTVENSKSGWELPKTGGFGTTIFTFVGLLLMAGAIYIYARKEKSAVQ